MKKLILIMLLSLGIIGCGDAMGRMEIRDAKTKEVECSFSIMPWHFFDMDGTIARICGEDLRPKKGQ